MLAEVMIPHGVLGSPEASRLVASIREDGGGGQSDGQGGTVPPCEPPWPPHIIPDDEVDAWLADSVNKVVTYHRTTRAAALDIIEQGVDVTRSRIGAYGQGFYTATDTEAFPGDVAVPVAIRTLRPLVGDLDEIGDAADAIVRGVAGPRATLTPRLAAIVREEFLQQGYDGIIVVDGGGDGIDYVVALENHTVKVVLP